MLGREKKYNEQYTRLVKLRDAVNELKEGLDRFDSLAAQGYYISCYNDPAKGLRDAINDQLYRFERDANCSILTWDEIL